MGITYTLYVCFVNNFDISLEAECAAIQKLQAADNI